MQKRRYKSMNPRTVLVVRQVVVGVMIAAFLSMLTISIWYVSRLEMFTINKITIRGGETIPHEQIEAVVRQELSGSYFKIIPRSFAFTYPEETVIESIRNIERIKDLSVVRSGGTELSISFSEYEPHALWCKQDNDGGCFFLDENGYSFTEAPNLIGGSLLRFVSIGQDPIIRAQAFNVDQYHVANELAVTLGQKNWPIEKIEIDSAGDAFMTVSGGGEFKTTLKQSPNETVSNLDSVLASDKFKHFKPGNFEYVDLRFGSKVFVNEHTIDSGIGATSTQLAAQNPATAPATPAIASAPADNGMSATALMATAKASTTIATSTNQ